MKFETIKKYISLVWKDPLGRVCDFLVYYCLPPKTVVLIMSSQRSGSTLLKALLGEAQDISHLPEVDYTQYGNNSYYVYRKVYFLSKKRIIVLKYPGATTKLVPALDRIKICILVRDAYGVVHSLQKRYKNTEHRDRTQAEWLNRWCRINQRILNSVRSMNIDFCYVRYEDILRNPRATTKKLFIFLGSEQTEGVERYHEPKDFGWKWGKDDASEKLKGLKVVQERSNEKAQDDELQDIIENSQEAQSLREKFGYLNNNSIEVKNKKFLMS